jgi:NADPH-dependent 2,4-dienoyl-CoA reductase/sulfur reductase-like enzyme
MRIPNQDQSNGWQRDIPVHTHEPLAKDLTCDVLIVGGGYTGLNAALTFQQHYHLKAI